ncbi:MAG: hypothetical protein A2X40_05650 [Elusimicrobia bacterium GWC2_65_9]|nr:MAG: hypothetical protein A2X37_06970 [Elusimicrobia bacterium GWA2_66_18]OGR71858.1 MAG: hypothetical protein A2X40_05650 [Elusimicrobia bacterium GWC2_65_9]
MVCRCFAVFLGLAAALSWTAPLCAAVSAPKAEHSCCQAPSAPKDAGSPCCCRPLDRDVPHSEVPLPSASDVLIPGAAVVVRRAVVVRDVARVAAPRCLDASPPAPTGLSPPASV